VRKVIDASHIDESRCIRPRHGKIKRSGNMRRFTTLDFGRIAASSARQVINRNPRGEMKYVYNEFQGRWAISSRARSTL
jgi:hypothetical protein